MELQMLEAVNLAYSPLVSDRLRLAHPNNCPYLQRISGDGSGMDD